MVSTTLSVNPSDRLLTSVPARRPTARAITAGPARELMSLERESDEELAAAIRAGVEPRASTCREVLFRRLYPKVWSWCRRFSGDDQDASDLAQEVLLRVHQRIHTFEGKSRFSTWLYTVSRRVAINRGLAAKRRPAVSLETTDLPEPADPDPGAEQRVEASEIGKELRRAMARDLEPLEAKVLYLHYVDGMTLPAITDLLGLENKSGAKAYIVSGRRRLDRRFGPWLRRQSATTVN